MQTGNEWPNIHQKYSQERKEATIHSTNPRGGTIRSQACSFRGISGRYKRLRREDRRELVQKAKMEQ